MRRVLHVAAPGASVRQDGGRIVVDVGGRPLASVALEQLAGVYLYGRGVSITTPMIALLMEAGIPLAWLTRTGRLRARCVPPTGNDVLRRIAQFERCRDAAACLAWSRVLCHRKLAAQAALLRRRWRTQGRSTRALSGIVARFHRDIEDSPNIALLRAVEGRIGRLYFRSLARTLPPELRFTARRRPADGVVNAGFNLLYTILTLRLDALAEAAGLDPGIAPFHRPAWGRPTLGCDLVEPLRAPIVDAFWSAALSRRQFSESDVVADGPHGGHRFTQEALSRLLSAWEAAWEEQGAQSRCDAEVAAFRRWCEDGRITHEERLWQTDSGGGRAEDCGRTSDG
ncbi:MAG: CRISPR-associated endonuclease Cas1 [Planctomycetota bacterium]|nr:CRISPR-associated endonuclease Cas1 [Planctomycetota bacterium]MCX8039216.1 CRISPR-associated endonuclease Cas1 [Planctomycetota bacterium]